MHRHCNPHPQAGRNTLGLCYTEKATKALHRHGRRRLECNKTKNRYRQFKRPSPGTTHRSRPNSNAESAHEQSRQAPTVAATPHARQMHPASTRQTQQHQRRRLVWRPLIRQSPFTLRACTSLVSIAIARKITAVASDKSSPCILSHGAPMTASMSHQGNMRASAKRQT